MIVLYTRHYVQDAGEAGVNEGPVYAEVVSVRLSPRVPQQVQPQQAQHAEYAQIDHVLHAKLNPR